MLPDTFFGGVTLSIVNMMVVFVVLGALAAIIRLIHTVVSKLGLDSDVTPTATPKAPRQAEEKPAMVSAPPPAQDSLAVALPKEASNYNTSFAGIDSKKAGAIIAALAVSASSNTYRRAQAVFLRRTADSGAWGRSGGPKAIGASGAYRSQQFVCEDQPVQVAAGD